MKNLKIFFDTIIILVLSVTAVYLYTNYWTTFRHALFGDEPTYTIYLGSKSLEVTVADTEAKQVQGLSGVKSLKDFGGELFIFPDDAKHYMWMKDMYIPLDMIWIDKNLKIVHIEENVTPESYPQAFSSEGDSRFVLEVNAHLVSTIRVAVGDEVTLPSGILPKDIAATLQK